MSETAKAPVAIGTLRQYREGWNDAANGALPIDCPYHGSADVELWTNGLYDFLQSPFNCEARRRFNLYRLTSKISAEELKDAEVLTEDDGFDVTIIHYPDGSKFVLTPTLAHAEVANVGISATCERALEAEMELALAPKI